MRILVTGGAGFIGRWVVKNLLQRGHAVTVLDDFSNGSRENLAEFSGHPGLAVLAGDVRSEADVAAAFAPEPAACIHLAAKINVQESIDDPDAAFAVDVLGTYNVLKAARHCGARVAFASTCMVYAACDAVGLIDESHPVKPASPYVGAKLAGEALALSYHHAYGLPVVILRPFNTYGPCQKGGAEGGVVSVFLERALEGADLMVYGDGSQTRDLLYVEDCAEFIARASLDPACDGQILNAGTGEDIAIRDLALIIAGDPQRVRFVPHLHPQSEVARLRCDYSRAARLLGWRPEAGLREGIARTRAWHEKRKIGR